MLEQFSVSDRKLGGGGGGDTGVFLSLLLMVYIPHLSHRPALLITYHHSLIA